MTCDEAIRIARDLALVVPAMLVACAIVGGVIFLLEHGARSR